MLSDIKSAVDVAKTLIGMVREQGTIAADTKANALEALMKAITATRQYVSKAPERSGEFDMKAEDELTNLWIAASRAVEPIDSDLAERCFMKAYGWADKVQFDSPKFQELRINLDDIAEDIRQIIRQ